MASSGYSPWSVTVGEQPTTAYWNLLGTNDSSFNTGTGFNDQIITWRHLSTDLVPVGTIHAYGGSSAPSSAWLLCDGSAVPRSTYAALFSVVGTMYGSGDGSTTFNVPNASGHVVVGVSPSDANFASIGQTGGEDSHTLSYNEMPVHGHGVNDPGHNHGPTRDTVVTSGGGNERAAIGGSGQQFAWNGSFGLTPSGTGIWLSNAGGGAAHNNLQPYLVANYIIKT